ncbi:MAG: bifunctional UDP-N-acetylmuramoyl-tripeptide:D-alanyl-D-alanine ligase/alanine racemase [Bacteroidota bacterium]
MLGIPYTIQEIAQYSLAQDLFQGEFDPAPVKYLAWDSRSISHGKETLFVALSTDNRDGHDYISQAYEKGVRNFLTSQKLPYKDVNYALCENTLETFQLWARNHRRRFDYPVVAITGSNGKTIVKEWLTTLLEAQFQVVKSPMSYNSQIGVPASLLQLHPMADIAIIEAGISQPDEMDILHELIFPTHGILTHMGDAHADGFTSFEEKLTEKAKLFQGVRHLWMHADQEEVFQSIQAKNLAVTSIGRSPEADLQITSSESYGNGAMLQILEDCQTLEITLLQRDEAFIENTTLSMLAARKLGMEWEDIQERVSLLSPVEMRTEMITDNPEITIINDAYNSDLESIRNALQVLVRNSSHPKHILILSDIMHLGDQQVQKHQDILKEAEDLLGAEQVYTIGPVFHNLRKENAYLDTKAFMKAASYEGFRDTVVLLKGARPFRLENILPLLNQKLNSSAFVINLEALSNNYRYLKSLLPEGTKSMCMVKAYAYGSGSWEIASALEQEGATYLTVAYTSEAISLRQKGIRMPIMVMNANLDSIPELLAYDIEPQVYSLDFLEKYLQKARLSARSRYRIHLKLETGMGRLGLKKAELNRLVPLISLHPDLEVISVMTHLAAADEAEADDFSHKQVKRFQQMYAYLQENLGLQAFRHVLNTAGILRFPEYSFEMVRMGIGLYGISPTDSIQSELTEIGSLITQISQIQEHPNGTSIGYGRAQTTTRDSRIATIPLGYADGIPRSLGNGKISFLINGQPAPTFGRICMDMLMLDVTDIPSAKAGDEVVLIGKQGEQQVSVVDLAKAADTIPYEILVRISPRVRRVYVR